MRTQHSRACSSLRAPILPILRLAACAALLLAACESYGPDADTGAKTDDAADSASDPGALPDTAADVPGDPAGTDAPGPDESPAIDVPSGPAWADVPEPSETLVAGAAVRSMHIPIGAPTAGYGPKVTPDAPSSRFTGEYPGTNKRHTDLNVKAVVLRRGGKAMVLARLDLVGAWDAIVFQVRAALRDLGRGDLADGLILSGTHTHSGPGRFIDHIIGNFAADTFSDAMFKRICDAALAAVLAADEAAVPARVGHITLETDELHNDRRCENGPIQDDTLGVILVEDLAAEPIAVLVTHSMHGTVLNADDYTLSSDAPGGVERGIELALPVPAPVVYLQGWAGDMSPGGPSWPITAAGHEVNPDYARLDALGAAAAAVVMPALPDIVTTDTPELDVITRVIPVSGLLANPDGCFDDYPYGGIYCVPEEDNCWPDGQPYTELHCLLTFTELSTKPSAVLTTARIGDLLLSTLPGEATTQVGTALRDAVKEATGFSDVYVLGYTQGYMAYIVDWDDYWYGGYEAASTIFGPGFGDYLVRLGTEVAARLFDPDAPLSFEPLPIPGPKTGLEDWPVEEALGAAAIEQQPTAADVVTMRWVGGDPAVDFAVITLERQAEGGAFEPVLRSNGSELNSDGPEIEVQLAADPDYADDEGPVARRFTYTARLPSVFSVPPAAGQLQGTYRFVIRGERPEAYELESDPFTL